MLRFRESFRGYNRDDVNAYIEQMNLRFSRKEAELRSQIAELQSSASKPEKAEESTVSPELEELKAEVARLTSDNDTLKKELEEEKAKTAGGSETEEKSKLYDSMSSQVGNILIVANSNADKIVSDAESEAIRIKAEAQLDAEKIKLEADRKMNTMIAELDSKIKSMSDSYIDDYRKIVSEAQVKFSLVTDDMKKRSEQLLVNADSVSKDIERQISEEYRKAEQSADKE